MKLINNPTIVKEKNTLNQNNDDCDVMDNKINSTKYEKNMNRSVLSNIEINKNLNTITLSDNLNKSLINLESTTKLIEESNNDYSLHPMFYEMDDPFIHDLFNITTESTNTKLPIGNSPILPGLRHNEYENEEIIDNQQDIFEMSTTEYLKKQNELNTTQMTHLIEYYKNSNEIHKLHSN